LTTWRERLNRMRTADGSPGFQEFAIILTVLALAAIVAFIVLADDTTTILSTVSQSV
jgi:hypothetical protein